MLQYATRISIHRNTSYTEFICVLILIWVQIFRGSKYYVHVTGHTCGRNAE